MIVTSFRLIRSIRLSFLSSFYSSLNSSNRDYRHHRVDNRLSDGIERVDKAAQKSGKVVSST